VLIPPDNPAGDDFTKWFSRTTNELRDCTKTPEAFLRERVDRLNEKLRDTKWNKCTNWKKGWRLEASRVSCRCRRDDGDGRRGARRHRHR